jgi:hypothetical protein
MHNATGKERSGIAWLLAGVWELKEIRKKIGKEDVENVFLSCS